MFDINDHIIQRWLDGAQKIVDDHMKTNFPSLDVPKLTLTQGRRYIKVIKDRSVHAFIDRTNGNILKPEGWSKPAKHARGNLSDQHDGLGMMGPYGPAYLK